MKIEYLGHSCFRIVSAQGTVLVTDPYTKVGYELPKTLVADVVTVSHGHFDHNFTAGVSAKTVFDRAGAYAFEDIRLDGFVCDHDPLGGSLRGRNIVYKIFVDGVTVCHLGDLGEPCSKELVEKIGKIDVLLIPVGGTYTVDAPQAKEYIERIRPKLAVPMHYRPDDGTLDIASAEDFLRLYENVVCAEKNTAVDVMQFASDKTKIVFMERTKNE